MEYKRKCNTCGKVFCYTDEDIAKNIELRKEAASEQLTAGLDFLIGRGSVVGNQERARADQLQSQIVDYSRCPSCGSKDIVNYSGDNAAEFDAGAAVIAINSNATVDSLLKRATFFLEDRDWASANAYCEHILDSDPECAEAYVYKLLAEKQVSTVDMLASLDKPISDSINYKRALKFAGEEQRSALESANNEIRQREAEKAARDAREKHDAMIAGLLSSSDLAIQKCGELLDSGEIDNEEHRQLVAHAEGLLEKDYIEASRLIKGGKANDIRNAELLFSKLGSYKDSEELRKQAEEKYLEKKSKSKKMAILLTVVVVAIVAIVGVVTLAVLPDMKKQESYNLAVEQMENGEYGTAIDSFAQLGDYKDANAQITEAKYLLGIQDLEIGAVEDGKSLLEEVGSYKDAEQYLSRIIIIPKSVQVANSVHYVEYDSNGFITTVDNKQASVNSSGQLLSFSGTLYENSITYNGDGTITRTSQSSIETFDSWGHTEAMEASYVDIRYSNTVDDAGFLMARECAIAQFGRTRTSSYKYTCEFNDDGSLKNIIGSSSDSNSYWYVIEYAYLYDCAVDINTLYTNLRLVSALP